MRKKWLDEIGYELEKTFDIIQLVAPKFPNFSKDPAFYQPRHNFFMRYDYNKRSPFFSNNSTNIRFKKKHRDEKLNIRKF